MIEFKVVILSLCLPWTGLFLFMSTVVQVSPLLYLYTLWCHTYYVGTQVFIPGWYITM